jgi:hypothetical protein
LFFVARANQKIRILVLGHENTVSARARALISSPDYFFSRVGNPDGRRAHTSVWPGPPGGLFGGKNSSLIYSIRAFEPQGPARASTAVGLDSRLVEQPPRAPGSPQHYSDGPFWVHSGSRDSDSDNSDVPKHHNTRREEIAIGRHPTYCFLTKLCPDMFNPLMLAMARAVPRMPPIRRL